MRLNATFLSLGCGALALLAGCSESSSTDSAVLKEGVLTPDLRADLSVLTNLVTDCTWYPAEGWEDTPDPVASPRAKKGGVLRFDGSSSPSSFNAYIDTSSYMQMMFAMMYPVLVSTDTETLEFVPSLASHWAVSNDGSSFTFIVDERAFWSDGVPVTAEDVKWTYDQVMDKKSESGFWKLILGDYEEPKILDAGAKRPLVVQFNKKRDKDGRFKADWRDLTHCGMFYILPKHHFEGKDFNTFDFVGAPVCGPYRIASTEEQVETVYARVKEWWKADFPSCRHVYNFDRIVMRYYGSKENAFQAVKKGIIDVYPVYSARIMATETFGPKFSHNWLVKRRVNNHEPIGYQGFAMNMRKGKPFEQKEVRQAMAMLIDRERINDEMMYNEYFMLNSYFADLYGEMVKTNNTQFTTTDNVYYAYDFDAAKAKLAEAGYVYNDATGKLERDGKPLSFTFLARDGHAAYLTRFAADLKRLGIEMRIDNKDFASWMRDMDVGNFDMTWASYTGSIFRDPEITWHSSQANVKGGSNHVGFVNAKVDELIAREKTMKTFAERKAAYREIDHLITEECPHAFLWTIAAKRLIYWNKFGMPDTVLSRYNNESDVLAYWWYDPDRDEELREAMDNDTYLPSVPEVVDYDTVMEARGK